jgi:hypothetical protein
MPWRVSDMGCFSDCGAGMLKKRGVSVMEKLSRDEPADATIRRRGQSLKGVKQVAGWSILIKD